MFEKKLASVRHNICAKAKRVERTYKISGLRNQGSQSIESQVLMRNKPYVKVEDNSEDELGTSNRELKECNNNWGADHKPNTKVCRSP